MIIKELVLHNFGVYAATNRFEFHGKKPVVLIGGMNGRGKTTFLEAVLLSLYGSNSFAYKESKYKSFGQYLKSFVNVSDGTLETYVDLEFSMDDEMYRIHREWSGAKQRVSEKIRVYKDGEYNQFLTDNWTMFIENILPSGLSNFFFFDGEKIAELAVEKTSAQMKSSIKTLLGISVLDILKDDLGRIINRAVKNSGGDRLEANEIEMLREKRDQAVSALENIDQEIASLEDLKVEHFQELEQKRQEYSAMGGDIIVQRQELFQKRTIVQSNIDTLKEQLISDAASELPFLLVKDLLENVRKQAEIEQDQRMLTVALEKMRAMLPKYVKSYASDQDAAERFITFIDEQIERSSDDFSYQLSDTSLFKLQMLLDDQLLATKLRVSEHRHEYIKLQKEMDQLDRYLAVEIDEESLAKVYREIKMLEQKIIDIDVKLERKREKRRKCNGEAMNAISAFNRYVEAYLKRAEVSDDEERIVKYSYMAISILDEYQVRLQRKKIGIVADTMTACYKKLANKKNLIDRVDMDPVTLDLLYFNASGEVIDKASLSAGEKQLMVISLLWALALCAKKKLPVIIDTPLSRLDSAHRVSLIQTYFPQASEQTIILSTDSEIDQNYYKIMKDDIGDEFTLIYDDMSKSTTIRQGYFTEGLI
ncbi:MAG: DNA sulfur modification protein DndD [Peptococcaceae bacterium]|nr:DNA sulfur modification protein DndD [Peptococcaceae bacterium]